MDFVTMQTRVRSQVGNPTAIDVTDDVIRGLVNDAYIEIAEKFRFHTARRICRFDTIIGTTDYDLPTDAVELMRVRDNTSEKLLRPLPDNMLAALTGTATQGKPLYFHRYKNYVHLHPIPDAVVQIEIFYKVNMGLLVADSDVPLLPVAWHTGIVRLARYNYYSFVKVDVPKAIAAKNEYKEWLSDKPVELEEELRYSDFGVSIAALAKDDSESLDFEHSE